MGIVNKRNAIVGWLVIKAGKRQAKKKAQAAGVRGRGIATGAVAGLGGVLVLWRKLHRQGRGGDAA
ncbi:MAG TPA: hypothetical protein VII51_03055 [Gaiellaceae bacterium]